jgi:alpha-beta hydrolase superfamily lysophospholipase
VVLYLHGWSDYFFNTELAAFWHGLGADFYALDMHNHGRNIREDTLGGYVADLHDYEAELDAALAVVTAGRPAGFRPVLMGHSTGGLVAALWAARRPDGFAAVVLNSPWLEMHGSALTRHAGTALVAPLARLWPERRVRAFSRNYYWRSISSEALGEWNLDRAYRPPFAFPIRWAWLRAVMAGQGRVARGLGLRIPVLVLMSARSLNGPVWKEQMLRADAVLDVRTMARRAAGLGDSVSLERIDGALHDVLLSNPAVRAEAYRRIRRWAAAYLPADPADAPQRDNSGDTGGEAREEN